MEVLEGSLGFKGVRDHFCSFSAEFIGVEIQVQIVELKFAQILFQACDSLFGDLVADEDQVE